MSQSPSVGQAARAGVRTSWEGRIAGGRPGELDARMASWLMTSRRGGVSEPPFDDWNLAGHVDDDPRAVATNRAVIASIAGLPADSVVMMRQCHSAEVAVVSDAAEPEIMGVDALVTDQPDLVLVALAADCVPLVLVDADAGVVSAVHSGWQGMVSDVTGAALAAMVDLGARHRNIRAVLGPAICGPCYPVPPERAAEAAAAIPASLAQAVDGQPAIDVRRGLVSRLRDAGIRVETAGGCTAESPDLFSYRRDGTTGRQGAAVWWTR